MLIITDDEDFDIKDAQLGLETNEDCASPTFLGFGQNRYENPIKVK